MYDDDEDASVISPDKYVVPDPADSIYITRGYSKDRRPYLKQYMIGNVVQEDGAPSKQTSGREHGRPEMKRDVPRAHEGDAPAGAHGLSGRL